MSISENDFENTLMRQASQFANRTDGDRKGGVRTYIICDFEFKYDRSRHAGYCTAEGEGAEERLRWPFHTIAAASWVVMRCRPGLDTLEFDLPVVMSNEEHTGAEMTGSFFDALFQERNATVVTWGGEVKDLSVLRRIAAESGLLLPPQICDLSPLSFGRIDLCDASSVRSESVHLPEFAAACSIPAKPSPSKSIGKLVENWDWPKVEEQVLADVITTATILIQHLTSRSVIACNRQQSIMKLAEAALIAAPANDFAKRTFLPWARARVAAAGLRGIVYRADESINQSQ